MDGSQFDALTRSLVAPKTRRGLLGSLAAFGAGILGARATDAQVSQVSCGNQFCASNPGSCKPGCVCCVYTNPVTGQVTNSRCRPPGTCSPGTAACPAGLTYCPSLGRCAACCADAGCAPGMLCLDGSCHKNTNPHPVCAGETCGAVGCTGVGGDCACVSTVEGGGLCVDFTVAGCGGTGCETSLDCPNGLCVLVEAPVCNCGGATTTCIPFSAACT